MREGAGLPKTCVGFSMHVLGLNSEVGRNPLKKRVSSATLHAQSIAAELGRDQDIRRNVPMGVFLAPQPKAREKKVGRRRTASQKKKNTF